MESQNSQHRRAIVGWWRRWLVLVAITPLLIVHRIALWIDGMIFPSLRRQEVQRPLFIVGLPRSGTTFLHRLIAERSQFTTLRLWELVFAPALCEKWAIYALHRLDSLVGNPCERTLNWLTARLGGANSKHATSLSDAEEDFLGLLAFDGCFLRVLIWPFSARSWRLAFVNDQPGRELQQQLLKHYRGLLARHLRFRGTGQTLVSKNPSFTAWMPGLASEFPDARFIALRRIPGECVPSQLSAIRDALEFFGYQANDPRIVQRFLDLLAHYWNAIDKGAAEFPHHQLECVDYRQLTSDPFRVVTASLQVLGYWLSELDLENLRELSEQGRQYKSQHRYSLAEFGLTTCQIDTTFAAAGMGTSAGRSPADFADSSYAGVS